MAGETITWTLSVQQAHYILQALDWYGQAAGQMIPSFVAQTNESLAATKQGTQQNG